MKCFKRFNCIKHFRDLTITSLEISDVYQLEIFQWIKKTLFLSNSQNSILPFQMQIADILKSLKTQTFTILQEEKCSQDLFCRMLKTYFLVSKQLDVLHSWNLIKIFTNNTCSSCNVNSNKQCLQTDISA